MNKKLLLNDYTIPKGRYKLIDDLSHFEKKKIKTNWNFSVSDLQESYLESIENFLKNKSLKEALKKTFNLSSNNIIKFYENNIITKDNDYIYLNLNYFISIKLLSEIFLNNSDNNHNDFVKILSHKKTVALIAPLYEYSVQLNKFLNENFNNNQIADFLINSSYFDEPIDTVKMYISNDKHMNLYLKKINWIEKNSFKKCHDLLATETTKIAQKNFLLNQESFFNVSVFLNYRFKDGCFFKNPESFHDLIEYGSKLRHCIGSIDYAKRSSNGECLLLSIYDKNDKLKYTIEILKNGNIKQIQGISGQKPADSIIEEIRKLIKNNKILK